MDSRAAKLALARQKLKSHQEKKLVSVQKDDNSDEIQLNNTTSMIESKASFDYDSNTVTDSNVIEIAKEKPFSLEKINNNTKEAGVNVTEILISSKRNLEVQVAELQSKLSHFENNYTIAVNNNDYCKQQINHLEQELKVIQDKYSMAYQEILTKDKTISELNNAKSFVLDENNNLLEQLELTRSVLAVKESENASLHNQLNKLQNQLDATQLQLQQLTNGSHGQVFQQNKQPGGTDTSPEMSQKISSLEEQLKMLQKERDQINCHYEHYVGELNDQLKSIMAKNHELSMEVYKLSARENNLVDQISEMEIRLQMMKQQPLENLSSYRNEINELQQKYTDLQAEFHELQHKHETLQKLYSESESKVRELKEAKESAEHENISMSKLNADIASDKVAAQRATEQNKKLKNDLQELEEAFVKISKDKLELTEKLSAEKYLNRELTIKLAEIEEKAKDMHIKLLAKDDEMIRLQQSCREQERKFENITEHIKLMQIENRNHIKCDTADIKSETDIIKEEQIGHTINASDDIDQDNKNECQCLIENNNSNAKIPKEDAMIKLQERFLKIMGDVADLSDEKHRLEHIILQLQNETDTICEYVALYQQQRSLLKKRDEERSAQIKIFQTECELLKNQLEELSGIILRLAQDTELATYFQVESRQADLTKVLNLLSNLKNSTLIDPHRTSSELKNFYPCSCCSGKLIDV